MEKENSLVLEHILDEWIKLNPKTILNMCYGTVNISETIEDKEDE